MKRPDSIRLAAFLLAALAIFGGVALAKGGLFIEKHEGDTYQLIEIIRRLAEGQVPHLDFMTPIGILATAPIAFLVDLGMGYGLAFLMAQVLVAGLLLPAVLRVAASRLEGVLAYVFGLTVIVLVTAIVHGEADRSLSISMHYNRWAWAVSYVVLALVLLPPRRAPAPGLDGALIGIGLAALALTKITYFVAFLPPVVLVLIVRRESRMLLAGLIAGLAVAGIVTLWAGFAYWPAYLGDLLAVSDSEGRRYPGEDFINTLTAPAYLGATFILLATIVLLRQAGQAVAGMAVLFLAPGFAFVAFQNYGNDPQWLYFVAILLFALRPAEPRANGFGWDLRQLMLIAGVAAFTHGAPSALNLAYSPFRHFFLEEEAFDSLLSRPGQSDDLRTRMSRLYRANGRVLLDLPGAEEQLWAKEEDRLKPTLLMGEKLEECNLQVGMNAWFAEAARDLEAAGFAGQAIFAADIFNAYPLFGDFPLLEHGAPWYYAGLSGLEAADLVIVPLCPLVPDVRASILKEIEAKGIGLTEVRRTELYILLRKIAS